MYQAYFMPRSHRQRLAAVTERHDLIYLSGSLATSGDTSDSDG